MDERPREPLRPLPPDSPLYDPRIPDEVRFREHEAENPGYDQTLEGRAEAAETTRGEELRPKDGTLDPSSAR